MIFQAFLIAFAAFALAKTYRQYKDRKVSLYWMLAWSLLWLVLIVAAFMPWVTDSLAQYVGVERGADLFVYVSIVFIFYAVYRILVRQEKLQKEITDLVREIAIKNAEKKRDYEA